MKPKPVVVIGAGLSGLCCARLLLKYAPADQALVSVSVVGKSECRSGDVANSVHRQLREWYGAQVDSWSLLKRYHIPFALPCQPAHFRDNVSLPARLVEGVYHCGDYAETASIQGAMISGRKTGEALIADLSVTR